MARGLLLGSLWHPFGDFLETLGVKLGGRVPDMFSERIQDGKVTPGRGPDVAKV